MEENWGNDSCADRKSIWNALGRSDPYSTSGRKHIGNFAFDYFTDSYRNLFYNPDSIYVASHVAGHGTCTGRKERRKFQPFHVSDADRVYSYQSGNGQSGRCCGSGIHWRSRFCFLDVGDGADRFLYCICRGNPGADPQAGRSAVWWISGWPGVLYPGLCAGEKREENRPKGRKSDLGGFVCAFRSDLLVWNQSGDQ